MEFNQHVGISFEECCRRYARTIEKAVNKNAYRIKGCGTFNNEDLYQMAMIGFMKAYKEFNDGYRTQFKYYAYDMMKWEILNTLKSKRSTVYFPQSFCVIWSIASKRGIKDVNKLMKYVPKRLSESQVKRAMEWYEHDTPISLDKPIEDNKGVENSCYDTIKGADNDETVVIVNEFLSTLTKKQRQVVILLMDDMTQSEIAEELGISQSQVSRIIKSVQKAWLNEYEGDGV